MTLILHPGATTLAKLEAIQRGQGPVQLDPDLRGHPGPIEAVAAFGLEMSL